MLRLNTAHQVAEDLVGPRPATVLRRHARQTGLVNIKDDDVRVGLGCEEALGDQGVKQANLRAGDKSLHPPIAHDHNGKNQRKNQISPPAQAAHQGYDRCPGPLNEIAQTGAECFTHHRNQ